MKIQKFVAGATLAAMLATLAPAAPALANGAASTRNILLGIGAATYLIIQHNRKVHEKYAEDARRQAAAEQQANDAWAAYHSEQNAYEQEVAVNRELKREVAYQHGVVEQLNHELAMMPVHKQFVSRTVARASSGSSNRAKDRQVAMVSYGWGTL